MKYGKRASLLQVRSTEQQRILRSTRSDINAVLAAAQGIKILPIIYYTQPEVFSPALPKHYRDPGPQLQP